MKKVFIVFILMFIILSCDNTNTRPSVAFNPSVVYKKSCYNIIKKEAPVENKISWIDFILGNGSITKSQTVYYFILDGNHIESVDFVDYTKYNIGDNYCFIN